MKNMASKLASYYVNQQAGNIRIETSKLAFDILCYTWPANLIVKANPGPAISQQAGCHFPSSQNAVTMRNTKWQSVLEHGKIFMINILFMIKTAAPWTIVFFVDHEHVESLLVTVASFASHSASQGLSKEQQLWVFNSSNCVGAQILQTKTRKKKCKMQPQIWKKTMIFAGYIFAPPANARATCLRSVMRVPSSSLKPS